MSNQRSGLRFRIPSWFALSSAYSSQPPTQKSSNQPASTSPPTTHSNNASSAAAKQAPRSDEALNRNKSRTGTMPTGKVAQNSNSQSQTSKTKADSPPQPRTASQPHLDKPASPTKLNTQPSTPPRVESQPKVKIAQKSPPPSLQLPSPSKESSRSRTKLEKDGAHQFTSTEEMATNSSSPTNSPKVVTQLPQSEAINESEQKSTNELVPKPSSPKRSPQSATTDSSWLPPTVAEPTSAIDREPVAANSSDRGQIIHNEITGQQKEQMQTIPEDFESPLSEPGSNSSNMNHQREEITESHLKPGLGKSETAKVQVIADKELEKEKEVINKLQDEESGSGKHIKEHQSVAVQPKHTIGEMKKNVDNSNDDSHQEYVAIKGEQQFPINNVSKNNKSQLHQIKTPGDEGPSREESPTSVITLAGDNRGATMDFGSGSSRNDQGLYIHRGYNHNQDNEPNESATNAEENSNETESGRQKPSDDSARDIYINSNLQCLNNTIMLNSSITQRDPGVHVVPSHTSVESNKNVDTKNSLMHKADINITKAKRFTYEQDDSSSSTAKRAFAGGEWF